jgi:hypothetical protein
LLLTSLAKHHPNTSQYADCQHHDGQQVLRLGDVMGGAGLSVPWMSRRSDREQTNEGDETGRTKK